MVVALNNDNINTVSGSKCSCGNVSIPPQVYCRTCQQKPEVIQIPLKGKILSLTRLHVPAKGFPAPLGIALVELQLPYRIICNFRAENEYEIGDTVKLTIENDKFIIAD
jgi:uncharacterized OB-fold protein